jgi:ribosome biogenesis protein MAK21
LFYHKFFSQKNEKERAKAAKVDKRKDHDDSSILGKAGDDVEVSNEEASDTESIAAEEEEEEEENSDADEAEIWKVSDFSIPSSHN